MSPASSRGRHSRGFLWLQVIQAVITAYLSHAIGRRAAATGSSFLEDPGHAHLDPTAHNHTLHTSTSEQITMATTITAAALS